MIPAWAFVSASEWRSVRRVVLFAGLALLAVVNYLDLVGVLGLGWSTEFVGWLAGTWTLLVALTVESGEELRARTTEMAYVFLGAVAVALVAVVSSPEVGITYVYHVTPVGQVALATAPMLGNAWMVLAVVYGSYRVVSWFSTYLRLRATTPEERVLDREA